MRDRTAQRLGWIAVAAAAGALLVRAFGGSRWFDLYGVATIALLLAPALLVVMRQGLAARGRAKWLALIVVAPIVLAALIQIGFWLAYFSAPVTGIQLGMGRQMFQLHVARYMPIVYGAWGLAAAWVAWRAIGSGRSNP